MKPQTHWRLLAQEAEALSKSVKIKSEEGRILLNLLQRVIEVQTFGEPKTKALSTHHG